ncbi:MAG: tetratricopeptide repeat protein [Armatimonadetes bacterium]|nr:tetratricopeptide repeat protein [Armatimonadota bacterium]
MMRAKKRAVSSPPAFDVGNLTHRLTATGLVVAAGALAVVTGHDHGLGALASTASGISGNVLAADIHKVFTNRSGGKQDVLHNHDLTLAVGKAMGAVITRIANDRPAGEGRTALLRMAQVAPERWRTLSADQDPEFADIAEVHLPALLSNRAEEMASVRTLEVKTWESVLYSMYPEKTVNSTTIKTIAEGLHQGFAQALFEILKIDFAEGGKAFPALMMMVMGDTNAVVKETRADVKDIKTGVETLLARSQQPPHSLSDLPVSGQHEIPRRNLHFTGRDAILDEIRRLLQPGIPVALTGTPGIGKTETAAEYVYRHYPDQSRVYWVNADTPENLNLGFADIARCLHLPLDVNAEPAQINAAVKRCLAEQSGWLIVFNNVESASHAAGYYPPGNTGCLLLTTHSDKTENAAKPISFDPMGTEEGACLVLRRANILGDQDSLTQANDADQRAARAISQELGGLPLALDHAGGYMDSFDCGSEEYLQLYRTDGRSYRDKSAYPHDPERKTVFATFSLALRKVAETHPAAADLLYLCAFLAPDNIPEEIFTGHDADLGEHLNAVVSNPGSFREIVAAAVRSALLRSDRKTHMLTVHRLVQEVIKDHMTEDEQRLWSERVVRAVSNAFPDVEFSNWSQCARLLPHALICSDLIQVNKIINKEAGSLLNAAGHYLFECGQYTEAEPLLAGAFTIIEATLGSMHPDTATSLNNLAILHKVQGRYDRAEPLYARALAIREQALGPEHPDTAASLNNLAMLYQELGRIDEAQPLHTRALAIVQAVLGPEHPDTAVSLNNLAILYQKLGHYADAEPLLARVLAIVEATRGPGHPQTATSLNNLAELYKSRGHYADAEPLHRRALSIREQALGPEHPDTAISINNLASLYDHWGLSDEAEPLHTRALAIVQAALGPEHPSTATSLSNLALVYNAQGRYSEAEPLLARSLFIRETTLGPEHSDTAASLNNLAVLYQAQGRFVEAEPLHQRALAIREATLGPGHPETAASLNNLALLYQAQGRNEEAEPLYARALAIVEAALGPGHDDTATSLNNLAELYRSQGRNEEALPLYARALAIREQALGPGHPETAASLNNLALLYQAQGRNEEAEPLYEQALAIVEARLGPRHPHTVTILNNLVRFHESQGRYADAGVLCRRVLAIKEAILGPEDLETAIYLNHLAFLYYAQDCSEEALPLCARALAIREQALGPGHPDTAVVAENYAILLEAAGHAIEAEALQVRFFGSC